MSFILFLNFLLFASTWGVTTEPDDAQEHLASHPLAIVVQFVSHYGEEVDLFWDPRDNGRSDAVLQHHFEASDGDQTINTFIGHAFYFQRSSDKAILKTQVMKEYIGTVILDEKQKLAKNEGLDQERDTFLKEYWENNNKSRTWKNFWPRDKVHQYFYDVQNVAQRFSVVSHFPKWRLCSENELESSVNFETELYFDRSKMEAFLNDGRKHEHVGCFEEHCDWREYQRIWHTTYKKRKWHREVRDNETDALKALQLGENSIALKKEGNSQVLYFCRNVSAVDLDSIQFPKSYTVEMANRWNSVESQQKLKNGGKNTGEINVACNAEFETEFSEKFPGNEKSFLDACEMSHEQTDPYSTVVAPTDELFELQVLCNSPRVVLIKDFLSETEVAHIIDVGESIGLKRSTVAQTALVTLDRTSSTVWIDAKQSAVIADVYGRIANVVRLADPVRLTRERSPLAAESLQLVHYNHGDLYKSHYDYETSAENCRFVTFLMYLNTPLAGGNTSFPKADEACHVREGYFGNNPGKGSAVFFYNVFQDGNVDDSTLHFAEPPLNDSAKYMTNLWIWDKFFR